MKLSILCVLFVCACGPIAPDGGAQTPIAPPPPHLKSIDEVRGHWSGVDRDAWLYKLTFDHDAFTLSIDRAEKGTCEEKGKVVLGPDGVSLAFTYETDTCNPNFTGATVVATVRATSPSLTLAWPDAIVSFGNDDEEIDVRTPSARAR